MKKPLTILCAPSCAGKDFLLSTLVESGDWEAMVSMTTRDPRPGEVDGRDYHFVSDARFRVLSEGGHLMESVSFSDRSYGVSADEYHRITDSGRFPVVIVEPNGAMAISNWCHDNQIPVNRVSIERDRFLSLSRFCQRYMDAVASAQTSGRSLSDIKEDYASRIHKSLYEEGAWRDAIPWDRVLDVMRQPQDAVQACEVLSQDVLSGRIDVPQPQQSLYCKASKPPDSLWDMKRVIRQTLDYYADCEAGADTVARSITQSESERKNQLNMTL